MWAAEDIPNADLIFLRVHKQYFRGGFVRERAYDEHGGGMSTDWSKYSTPEETRDAVARQVKRDGTRKNPDDFGVVAFMVGEVRKNESITVRHSPLEDNRAHTDVQGPGAPDEENTAVRFYLSKIVRPRVLPASI